MKIWGILVAAGSGERFGADVPKAFAPLFDRPMWQRSLGRLIAGDEIHGAIVVVPEGWQQRAREILGESAKPLDVIVGGPTRQDSVRIALQHVPPDADIVVVHDAARPNVQLVSIIQAVSALREADGAIVALPIVDTLKEVRDGVVIATRHRADLWRAQTPQAFKADVLREAHAIAEKEGFEATDDAQLLEHIGRRVVVVPGDEKNLKVTTKYDLKKIEDDWFQRNLFSGIGYDAHAFADGIPLRLGGVFIPWPRGLAGHSDGDVLCHAIADALLGAACLGDLGGMFPSSDPSLSGIAGTEILSRVAQAVSEQGLEIRNVDSTVILQEPQIAPYFDEMRSVIGNALKARNRVRVKATTTDKLGVTGSGAGAAALAIATVGKGYPELVASVVRPNDLV